MDDGDGHLTSELVEVGALVAQGKPVEVDAVGHHQAARLRQAGRPVGIPFGERDPVVQAKQVRGVAPIGGQDHHVVHEHGQPRRQVVEGLGDNAVKVVRADGIHVREATAHPGGCRSPSLGCGR